MIALHNVSKNYGQKNILKDITFQLNKGEIVGLLGENGSGKTTLLNILTQCDAPSSGSLCFSSSEDTTKSPLLGYLPDIPPLYPQMTVMEYLSFVGELKNIPHKQEIAEFLDIFSLKEAEHTVIKKLSKGYQQRLGIVSACLGAPDLLILDEPTNGLDPKQILDFRNFLQKIKKDCCILFSSHILSEVNTLCDRILFLKNGSIEKDFLPQKGKNPSLEKLFEQGGTL